LLLFVVLRSASYDGEWKHVSINEIDVMDFRLKVTKYVYFEFYLFVNYLYHGKILKFKFKLKIKDKKKLIQPIYESNSSEIIISSQSPKLLQIQI